MTVHTKFPVFILFHTKITFEVNVGNRIHLIDARGEEIYYKKPCSIQLTFKIKKPEKNKLDFFANFT